jgi:acylphosphatase
MVYGELENEKHGGRIVLKVRAHVFVNGRVQGVFFRSETEYEANRRNVSGWVRNTEDGRVEAVFEGEKENVEELIDFCRRGPPGARVTKVDAQWENYTGEFTGFRIRYGY